MARTVALLCLPLASLAFSPSPSSSPFLSATARGASLPAFSPSSAPLSLSLRPAASICRRAPVLLAGGGGGLNGNGGGKGAP
ncbi:hypothetical protein T484DRAFT_1917106 [Baffinella frigidus]|nr:hypothetical protein T484DRAFT_1917106 [Cryptophyta sp. CCMP2293]